MQKFQSFRLCDVAGSKKHTNIQAYRPTQVIPKQKSKTKNTVINRKAVITKQFFFKKFLHIHMRNGVPKFESSRQNDVVRIESYINTEKNIAEPIIPKIFFFAVIQN